MSPKIYRIILPVVIGLFLTIILLQIRQSIIDNFYDEDTVFSIEPLFDSDLYIILYLPTLAIGFLFQFLVTLPVWNSYKKKPRYFGLKLWQLVGLCCIMFGVVFEFFTWYSALGITVFILKSLIWIGIPTIFWTGNLLTLYFIDKKVTHKSK